MPPRRVQWLAFLGGAFFGFDLLFFNIAVLRTSGATAVLLANNSPVFVGLGTWLLFHRRPAATFWYGLALALAGCAGIVAADTLLRGNIAIGDPGGDLLALTAAGFFAAYLMTTERVRGGVDTLTFSTLAVMGSVVTLLVVCLAMNVPLTGYTTRSWASLAGLGLISQLITYFAIAYALGHLPATVVSVGLLAQVPLTALLFVPVLGEPLSAAQMGGGALVLAGIYVVNRAPPSRRAGRDPVDVKGPPQSAVAQAALPRLQSDVESKSSQRVAARSTRISTFPDCRGWLERVMPKAAMAYVPRSASVGITMDSCAGSDFAKLLIPNGLTMANSASRIEEDATVTASVSPGWTMVPLAGEVIRTAASSAEETLRVRRSAGCLPAPLTISSFSTAKAPVISRALTSASRLSLAVSTTPTRVVRPFLTMM